MDPSKITEFTLEQLVENIQKADAQIEDLEAARTVLREEAVRRLDEKGITGTKVKDVFVAKVIRTTFSTTLEEARPLGAVKTKEVVDTAILKGLHDKGIEIPNTKVSTFLTIKTIEKKDDSA